MLPMSFRKLALASMLVVFAMGHGEGGCCAGDEAVLGPRTQATCPPGSSLTYGTFGQQFMDSYCTRCHSSTLTGEARMGATEFHDFDTLSGIRAVANHVDQSAGAGPAAVNDQMPPDDPAPTLEERQQLAEWLACGAP